MTTTVEIDAERDSPQTVAPEASKRDERKWARIAERWLSNHLTAVALIIVASGLVVRVVVAARSYLNPDEALHYLLINQPSVGLAYKASLTNAHPPLFFILIYYCHLLGRSELMLRLPSVLAGAGLCWATFKWVGTVFGRVAGLIALVMVAFSPSLVALSAQVRDYMLLLFFMVAALYYLAQALQRKSVSNMWHFSGFLCLAILTHYSAVFFALAAGLYALVAIADTRAPIRVICAWVGGQLAALAICAFLFLTHISHVENSIPEWASPFAQSYFRGGYYTDLFTFTREHTVSIFNFMFEQEYVSLAMLIFFIIAVAFLVGRDLISRDSDTRSRHLSILLLVPFAAVWGASIAGVYPYVGTRHTVFLEPFAIAAVSFLLATMYGQKLWSGLLIAALLLGASNASGKTYEPFITKANQSRSLMVAAANAVQQSVPAGDLILVDYQASVLLAYYLCGPDVMVPTDGTLSMSDRFTCGGHTVVAATNHVWKLTPGNFSAEFEKTVRAYSLKPGDRVWVFQGGWESNLDTYLPWHFPKFRCLTSTAFGDNLSLIPFVVGSDLLPAAPIDSCGK